MTEPSVHPYSSHAPVFTVDGRTEGRLAKDVLRLDVTEGALGLRTLVARFHPVSSASDGSADQLSYLDGEVLDFGSLLTVTLGPAGGERQLFRGSVSAVEVSFVEGDVPHVTVFAEDALMRLRLHHRTATYSDVTDADLAAAVAEEHGLGSAVDAAGPTYPLVQQWDESDLSFLRDRALRVDAELWVDSTDTLHLATRDRRPGADLVLTQGGDLVSVTARADLAEQRTAVTVTGWDNEATAAVDESAGPDVVLAEVPGGRTGPQVVADVFGSAPVTSARTAATRAGTAQSYAEAELLRRARRFVTVDGVTAGTPDLVPGAKLDLRRVGRPFEGDGYRATYVHHSYDLVTGYRTAFRAERPTVRT